MRCTAAFESPSSPRDLGDAEVGRPGCAHRAARPKSRSTSSARSTAAMDWLPFSRVLTSIIGLLVTVGAGAVPHPRMLVERGTRRSLGMVQRQRPERGATSGTTAAVALLLPPERAS